MPIAVFANRTFQVSRKQVYTLLDFAMSSALNTEKQDVTGKKPSTLVKGPDLDTINFSIPLDASFGHNVRYEYENWVALKDYQRAYSFILAGKPVGKNKYLIKSVSLNDTYIDNKGNIRKATLQLEFEEYVRPGTADSSSGSTSTSSSAPAKKTTTSAKKTTTKGTVSVANKLISDVSYKSTQKRTNTNVTTAVSRGSKR